MISEERWIDVPHSLKQTGTGPQLPPLLNEEKKYKFWRIYEIFLSSCLILILNWNDLVWIYNEFLGFYHTILNKNW